MVRAAEWRKHDRHDAGESQGALQVIGGPLRDPSDRAEIQLAAVRLLPMNDNARPTTNSTAPTATTIVLV